MLLLTIFVLKNLTVPRQNQYGGKLTSQQYPRACVVDVVGPSTSSKKNRDGVALSTLAVGRGDKQNIGHGIPASKK